MATITVNPTQLDITFTAAERIGGLVRDQSIPRSAITSVDVVDDGYSATRGVRAPGLGIPRTRKIGTWRANGAKHLVSVRRGEPAIRIGLTGQRYETLIIGSPDATTIAADIA